jgi:putative DNA primase/helicase
MANDHPGDGRDQGRHPDDPFYVKRDGTKSGKRVKIIMGSSLKPRNVTWLWLDWIEHGKLTIFAGRPGSLKTTIALDWAAGITRGGQWPDGTRIAPGNVVMWSGEDDVETTLLPRFLSAGGDSDHIGFTTTVEEDRKDRSFDPSRDMDALAAACAELGAVNMIIIDPLVSITREGSDSHKNAEARRDLQPVVDLAARTQAAVIGIHHLTKRSEGADLLDRISGSLAFGAAPRSALLSVVQKTASGPRGVLTKVKISNGKEWGGYDFTAETRPLDDDPSVSGQRIWWGAFIDEDPRAIVAKIEGAAERAGQTMRRAAAFVRDALKRGPRLAAEVIAEGEACGFSKRTLQRAFTGKDIGGRPEHAGFEKGGAWIWELPT